MRFGFAVGTPVANIQIVAPHSTRIRFPTIVCGKTAPGSVHGNNHAILIQDCDMRRQRIQRGLQKALRLPNCLCPPLAFGDVVHKAEAVLLAVEFQVVRGDLDREDASLSRAMLGFKGYLALRLEFPPEFCPALGWEKRIDVRDRER